MAPYAVETEDSTACSKTSSMIGKELDFEEYWINQTVEAEILRGAILRDQKSKLYPQRSNSIDVVNIDVDKPFCPGKRRKSRKPSKTKTKTKCYCKRPRSPLSSNSSSRTYILYNRPKLNINKQRTEHRAKVKRCPMRIAELAVPTKRQCIETWREKSYILPYYMVERLRQHVMDEKPVVQIPDAINCFKRRKKGTKRSSKSVQPCPGKVKHKVYGKCKRMDTKLLCAIFAYKVSQRLMKPLDIRLNPNLERISRIVGCDIGNITKNRKQRAMKNKIIHADVTKKVTIWIASILEESTYKLLEDDLRDLEEEEGHIWDCLDDLVDNVVSICEPKSPIYDEESSDSSSTLSQRDEMTEQDDQIAKTAESDLEKHDVIAQETQIIQESDNENEEITADQSIAGLLNMLIDSIGQDELKKESIDDDNLSVDEYTGINNDIVIQINKIIDGLASDEYKEDEDDYETGDENNYETQNDGNEESDKIDTDENNASNIETNAAELNVQENDTNFDEDETVAIDVERNELTNNDNLNADDLNPVDTDQDNKNVSEVFKLFGEDETNKKVKFSDIDLGRADRDLNEYRTTSGTDIINETEQLSWKSSNDIILNKINFAPPNQYLLSDADEKWPFDVPTPTLKASESVSKSITSLGKILESDEKNLMIELEQESDDNDNEINNNDLAYTNNKEGTIEVEETITNEGKKDEDLKSDLKNIIESSTSLEKKTKMPYDKEDEATVIQSLEHQDKKSYKDTDEELLGSNKITQEIDKSSGISPEFSKESILKDSTISIKQKQIVQTTENKDISKVEDGYRVYFDKAPAWTKNIIIESTAESFDTTILTECDVRKWCMNLNIAFGNVEMWAQWIQHTCIHIDYLKQNIEVTKKCIKRSCNRKQRNPWLKLKENIDHDALLWTKLQQRMRGRLKIYRQYYVVKSRVAPKCVCYQKIRRSKRCP